jgi:hypothetical protein
MVLRAGIGFVGYRSRPGSLEDRGFGVGENGPSERHEQRRRAARRPQASDMSVAPGHKSVPDRPMECDRGVGSGDHRGRGSRGSIRGSEGSILEIARVDPGGRQDRSVRALPSMTRDDKRARSRARGPRERPVHRPGGRARRATGASFPRSVADMAGCGRRPMPAARAIPTSGERHLAGRRDRSTRPSRLRTAAGKQTCPPREETSCGSTRPLHTCGATLPTRGGTLFAARDVASGCSCP